MQQSITSTALGTQVIPYGYVNCIAALSIIDKSDKVSNKVLENECEYMVEMLNKCYKSLNGI